MRTHHALQPRTPEQASYSIGRRDGKQFLKLYRIQSSGDTAERYSLMHQAETLLMQTGAVCPLYWYTDTYLCNTHVQGLLSGPLGAQYLMGAHVEK